MRRTIRGGTGLGDALYVQSVCRHLVEKGQSIRVNSAWPDVFRPLGDKCAVAPFSRTAQVVAHYPSRKWATDTTQFEDCCITAGVPKNIDLRLDWKPTNQTLIDSIGSRPFLCVQLPRTPMGRTDGFGAELLPDCNVIQKLIDRLRERFCIVQIGSGRPLHKFHGIDVDLANKTTVSDLLDVATAASGFLGYVSFIVPLAESLSKPALLVWSRRGLKAGSHFIRAVTPKKVLHKPSSKFIWDDATEQEIREVADAFMR